MLLLIQNESDCTFRVLWAWWLALLNLRGKKIPLYSFAESLVLWDAFGTWLGYRFRETFPNGFRAGSYLVLQLSLYLFVPSLELPSIALVAPCPKMCLCTRVISAQLTFKKKKVQEGSNVRGKEHRLHALESDTVALLCCLIAMKITLHNRRNLYLGWLLH